MTMENPNEPQGRRDPLADLSRRIDEAFEELRPKVRKALDELDARVDSAMEDIRPRVQEARDRARPRMDEFVKDVQPRVDSVLRKVQTRLEQLRQELEGRAARAAGGDTTPDEERPEAGASAPNMPPEQTGFPEAGPAEGEDRVGG
jgi:vacuolar-type H+-ATPase subunit H